MHEREIYDAIGNHYMLYMTLIEKHLHDMGFSTLSFSHGCVLERLIQSKKRMTMSELAIAINRDKSTCTQLVKKLEQLGLVNRLINCMDQRSVFIEASEKALEFSDYFDQLSRTIEATVRDALSAIEQEKLLGYLDRIEYQLSKRI